MIDNHTILQKADLALSDLTTDGGILLAAQAQKFIRILIDASKFLPLAQVKPMKSQKELVEKIRFTTRILRPAVEATALAAGQRVKPDLSKVELDSQAFKAEVNLNDFVLEDSIERGQFRQTVLQLMAERVGLDVEDVVINGDTGSADPTLAVLDGVRKQAVSNVVAAGGGTPVIISGQVFRDMLKTMPSEFLRRKGDLRFLTSVDAEIDYRDGLLQRATRLGDRFLETDQLSSYTGVPVMDIPVFPENLGTGTNETEALLLDPKNARVGIWRTMRIETDKDVRAGVLIIVISLRFDVKFEEETAVVKATEIKVSG